MSKKKSTPILVVQAIGAVMLCGGGMAGLACLLFGVSVVTILIGSVIGAGFGLIVVTEEES